MLATLLSALIAFSPPTLSRRQLATLGAAVAIAPPARSLAEGDFAADALNAVNSAAESTLLVPTPLGIISYGTKKRAQQQEACYAAGECADRVPYYDMECDRDDVECLARRRSLASKEINGFFADPLSSPTLVVFGLFLAGGPLAALTRATVAVGKQLLKPPDENE